LTHVLPSVAPVPSHRIGHCKGALGHGEKALCPNKTFLKKEGLEKDKDYNVHVNDNKLNGLAVEGKRGKDEEARGSKVKYQGSAVESFARVLQHDRIVAERQANEFRGELVKERHYTGM